MIQTNKGPMTPEGLIDRLTYLCYVHHRQQMTPKQLGRVFPLTGAAMEARYQAETSKLLTTDE